MARLPRGNAVLYGETVASSVVGATGRGVFFGHHARKGILS